MPKTSQNGNAIRLSVSRLSELFDIPTRSLNTILRGSGLSAAGGYDVCDAARVTVAHFKAELKRMDSEAKRDRDRQTKSEADISELNRGRLKRTMCLRDDYKNNYADAVAQGVRNIMRIKELSKGLRDKVFAAIRDVKLPEPSEEK